ncbi:MAG: glutaminyl-peptide cyclotransferase [Bacteroidales bacterium]|nr:glutaminyl-peptide cyclotransferase [Bacteroidales bacterium]
MMKRLVILAIMAALLTLSCSGSVKRYGIEVVAEYPHDAGSYTQGLFFDKGELYESTGTYGKSTFRKVDLETGEALLRIDYPEEYFGEGSVFFKDSLYVLTWENRKVFVYDARTMEPAGERDYPRQGWGLTTDGRSLVASDGSSRIYFLDKDLRLERKIIVRRDKHQIKWLNELEWIDGRIWANVYTTDNIVIINPRNGNVEGIIDLRGLLPKELRTIDTDVLNGIAYDSVTGKIYVTGKNWPRLYEIKLVRK